MLGLEILDADARRDVIARKALDPLRVGGALARLVARDCVARPKDLEPAPLRRGVSPGHAVDLSPHAITQRGILRRLRILELGRPERGEVGETLAFGSDLPSERRRDGLPGTPIVQVGKESQDLRNLLGTRSDECIEVGSRLAFLIHRGPPGELSNPGVVGPRKRRIKGDGGAKELTPSLLIRLQPREQIRIGGIARMAASQIRILPLRVLAHRRGLRDHPSDQRISDTKSR